MANKKFVIWCKTYTHREINSTQEDGDICFRNVKRQCKMRSNWESVINLRKWKKIPGRVLMLKSQIGGNLNKFISTQTHKESFSEMLSEKKSEIIPSRNSK